MGGGERKVFQRCSWPVLLVPVERPRSHSSHAPRSFHPGNGLRRNNRRNRFSAAAYRLTGSPPGFGGLLSRQPKSNRLPAADGTSTSAGFVRLQIARYLRTRGKEEKRTQASREKYPPRANQPLVPSSRATQWFRNR